jgi:anti-sigma-K factor RskA
MRHSRLTDELQEKASIYAAGAMPEDERREYARHLEEEDCTVCREEVRELQSAVNFLTFSLPLETPSASVKARLMAQAAPAVRLERAPARSWITWGASLAAVAASLALVVALRDNSQLRRLADSMNDRITQLESVITQQRMTLASLTSSDVRVVNLAGQGATPDAGARIFWDQAARKWYVYVRHLPPAPSGRTYQLWFVPKGGMPVSASVFNTGADGSSMAEISVPDTLGDLAAAAVTTEPAGGLPQPSGPYALLGQLN